MKNILRPWPSACLLILALAAPLSAQSLGNVPNRYDASLSVGGGIGVSVSVLRLAAAGTSERFHFGLGARSTFITGELDLKAAAEGFSGTSGAQGTMQTPVAALLTNVDLHLEWAFTDRVSGGLNLDVFGFTLGASGTGEYKATPSSPPEFVSAKPSTANLVGFSGDPRGSLNSEFYVGWRLNERFILRGGLSRQRVEYRTEVTGGSSAPRDFALTSNAIFVGLRFARQ